MSKEKRYSDENLQKAVSEVKSRSASAYQAGKKYNIPKTTLATKLKGQHGKKYESETVLSIDLENQLG